MTGEAQGTTEDAQGVAEAEDMADSTTRLERALERIVASAHGERPGAMPTPAVGARLDALIDKLRAALDVLPGEK